MAPPVLSAARQNATNDATNRELGRHSRNEKACVTSTYATQANNSTEREGNESTGKRKLLFENHLRYKVIRRDKLHFPWKSFSFPAKPPGSLNNQVYLTQEFHKPVEYMLAEGWLMHTGLFRDTQRLGENASLNATALTKLLPIEVNSCT